MADDDVMSRRGPRAGGPKPRRTFTPAEKLAHLSAYDEACLSGQGGAYLRREGLYSSQVTEWRKLRDGGLLEGKPAGAKVGRPNPEQAEIARLKGLLNKSERRATRAEAALEIMGKLRVLLEEISESTPDDPPPTRR
jgi:transposase-like protein